MEVDNSDLLVQSPNNQATKTSNDVNTHQITDNNAPGEVISNVGKNCVNYNFTKL